VSLPLLHRHTCLDTYACIRNAVQELGSCLQLARYDLRATRPVMTPPAPQKTAPPANATAASNAAGHANNAGAAQKAATTVATASAASNTAAGPPTSTSAPSTAAAESAGASLASGNATATAPGPNHAAPNAAPAEAKVTLKSVLPKCLKAAHLPNIQSVSTPCPLQICLSTVRWVLAYSARKAFICFALICTCMYRCIYLHTHTSKRMYLHTYKQAYLELYTKLSCVMYQHACQ
jgi:hypothetical protein